MSLREWTELPEDRRIGHPLTTEPPLLLRESAAGANSATDDGDDIPALRKTIAGLREELAAKDERLNLMYEIAEAYRGSSKPAKEGARRRQTPDGLTFDDDDAPERLRESTRAPKIDSARITFEDQPDMSPLWPAEEITG